MAEDIKRKTTVGIAWRGLERIASKGLQFVFSVIIARLLVPEDYGLMAFANLCISLADVLIDSGFTGAIIRKEERTEQDYNSVFYFNVAIAIVLYLIIWFIAPVLARYYALEALTPVIRMTTVVLLINALICVPFARLSVKMDFKTIALNETISMFLGGFAGIALAYKGLGVYALVAQLIVGCVFRLLLYYMFSGWRPGLSTSWSSLKEMFSFGSRLLVSSYVQRIYSAFVTMTVGKAFTPAELGYYGKADAFASTPNSILASPVSSVTLPAISKIQQDLEALRRNFVPMTALTAFVFFPCLLGLAAIAEPLIPLILTEKWSAIVPLMQILLLSYLFIALATIPLNYLMALGESGVILKIHLITKAVGIILLFPLSRISLSAVCWLLVSVSFISTALQVFFVWKFIRFDFGRFFLSLIPIILFSLLMVMVVTLIVRLVYNPILSILLGTVAGSVVYWLAAALSKNSNYLYYKDLMVRRFK